MHLWPKCRKKAIRRYLHRQKYVRQLEAGPSDLPNYCHPQDTALLRSAGLNFGLGLRQVHHAAALFPSAALFEQVDALETFEDVALGCDGAGGTKAAMLGHKG